MTIAFTVRGEPKGQPRPRAFAKLVGSKWKARVYDKGTAEEWKSQIALAAQFKIPDAPIEGPVKMQMEFNFKRPKSHYYTGKRSDVLRDDAPTWHTIKPDSDNLIKAVKDCLKTLGFYKDDSQVCVELVSKNYETGQGEGMRCVIEQLQPRIVRVQADGGTTDVTESNQVSTEREHG